MINSNVSTNFMSINFVNKKKLFTQSKNNNYSFITINDKTLFKKNNEFKNKIIIVRNLYCYA